MDNVFVYLRRSRDEDHDPEILSKHRSELLRLAAADGIEVRPENIHEEIGSADQIDSRPVFRALLAEWERLPPNTGGVLYSTEVSRLTRGLLSQQGRVQDALTRAGIRHRTRARWYDLSRPDDCTAWELEGFVARLEYRQWKARVAAAFEEMLRAGKVRRGRVPFGFSWNRYEGTVAVIPERFARLKRCCQEIHCASVETLARTYGIPKSTLMHALRNPFLCGYPCERFRAHDLLPRDQWRWPDRPNDDYPHACTRAEWEAIQAVLDERRTRCGISTYEEGWCQNVVWFPQSPGRCRLSVYTRPRGQGRFLTYERRPAGVPPLTVERALVHREALAHLTAFFTRRDWLEAALEKQRQLAQLAAADVSPDPIGEAMRELARLRRRYEETVDAEMDAQDVNHRHALAGRRSRLGLELERQEEELNRRRSQVAPHPDLTRLVADLPEMAGDFPAVWEEIGGEERRLLTESLLRRIEITIIRHNPRHHERAITAVEYQPWAEPER
jgi:hypothetical protein